MPDPIRTLVALVFAALLFRQSRIVSSRSNQRRAYLLAAAAMLLVAALNLLATQSATVQTIVAGAAFALLLAAVVFIVRGYFAGEMRADHQQALDIARKYRERRERDS